MALHPGDARSCAHGRVQPGDACTGHAAHRFSAQLARRSCGCGDLTSDLAGSGGGCADCLLQPGRNVAQLGAGPSQLPRPLLLLLGERLKVGVRREGVLVGFLRVEPRRFLLLLVVDLFVLVPENYAMVLC